MDFVFCYGTLMKGQSAGAYTDHCNYLGRGRVKGYTLADLGAYPGALASSHENAHVWGDLFALPENPAYAEAVWQRMRQYEGPSYSPRMVKVDCHSEPKMSVMARMFVLRYRTVPGLGIASWSPGAIQYDGVDRRGFERSERLGV